MRESLAAAPAHAIVIGIDDVRGVHVARTLARRGVPVLGVARDPNGPGTRTRACRKVLVTDTTTEEVVELLERLGPQFDLKPVLFPCLDHSVLTISRYREQLEAWYHVMLPSHEVVELLIDKIAFCRHANQAGLPIPETYFLLSRHDAERAATQLTFPCLIKPGIRSRRWYNHTHLKALKAHDAGEFLDLYDQYARLADGLIAQQWVPGPDACGQWRASSRVRSVSGPLRPVKPRWARRAVTRSWNARLFVCSAVSVIEGSATLS